MTGLVFRLACLLGFLGVCAVHNNASYLSFGDLLKIGLVRNPPYADCRPGTTIREGYDYAVLMDVLEIELGWGGEVQFECFESSDQALAEFDRGEGPNEIHAVAGGVAYTEELVAQYALTLPLYESGITIMSLVYHPDAMSEWAFAEAFDDRGWQFFSVSVLVVALCNWQYEVMIGLQQGNAAGGQGFILWDTVNVLQGGLGLFGITGIGQQQTNRRRKRKRKPSTLFQRSMAWLKPRMAGLGESMYSTICATFGASNTETITYPARVVQAGWIIIVFFMFTQYTANLTSLLMFNENTGGLARISAFEDLKGRSVGIYQMVPLPGEHFTQIQYETLNSLEVALDSGEIDAALLDKATALRLSARQCRFETGDSINPFFTGVLFQPTNAHIANNISRAIIGMMEEGEIDEFIESTLIGPTVSPADCGFVPSEGLGSKYLGAFVYFALSGFGIGFVLLLGSLKLNGFDFVTAVDALALYPAKWAHKKNENVTDTGFGRRSFKKLHNISMALESLTNQLDSMMSERTVFLSNKTHNADHPELQQLSQQDIQNLSDASAATDDVPTNLSHRMKRRHSSNALKSKMA